MAQLKYFFHDICDGNVVVKWFQHTHKKCSWKASAVSLTTVVFCLRKNIEIANSLNPFKSFKTQSLSVRLKSLLISHYKGIFFLHSALCFIWSFRVNGIMLKWEMYMAVWLKTEVKADLSLLSAWLDLVINIVLICWSTSSIFPFFQGNQGANIWMELRPGSG